MNTTTITVGHKFKVGDVIRSRTHEANYTITGVFIEDDSSLRYSTSNNDISPMVAWTDGAFELVPPKPECTESWWNIYPNHNSNAYASHEKAAMQSKTGLIARVHRSADGVVCVTQFGHE